MTHTRCYKLYMASNSLSLDLHACMASALRNIAPKLLILKNIQISFICKKSNKNMEATPLSS